MKKEKAKNGRVAPFHNQILRDFQPAYHTSLGEAYIGDSLSLMKEIPSESINLVLTSPPFALHRKKKYGNVSAKNYVEWFHPFAKEANRILTPDGSFVIEIGGSWEKGKPIRTLYHFELLIHLCKTANLFRLAQEFYWYNTAKIPGPAEWVNIQRIRVKDAVYPIWWLTKSDFPKASNKRVLTPYKNDMKELLENGYNGGKRPSGHNVSNKWGIDQGGAIPPNIIEAANTRSRGPYFDACRKDGIEPHPARFVPDVPEFFIKFLTEEGDLVLDPFAGSNMTGYIAEIHNRRWIAIDIVPEYIKYSSYRFPQKNK